MFKFQAIYSKDIAIDQSNSPKCKLLRDNYYYYTIILLNKNPNLTYFCHTNNAIFKPDPYLTDWNPNTLTYSPHKEIFGDTKYIPKKNPTRNVLTRVQRSLRLHVNKQRITIKIGNILRFIWVSLCTANFIADNRAWSLPFNL